MWFIYIILSINRSIYTKKCILFFGVNLSTGAVVGNSFQASSLPNSWSDSDIVYQYSTRIYTITTWGTKLLIFTYDTTTSTFIDYKQTVFGTHYSYLTYRNGMIYSFHKKVYILI